MAAKKKPTKRVGRPDPIDIVWLKARFDELERQHTIIVKLLKGGNVSDELATQIRLARGIGITIDRKVPDKQVPPKRSK